MTNTSMATGPKIKYSIGVVVAGCGFGGVILATVLALAWGNIGRESLELHDQGAAVSDLRRLDAELDHWALNVDLVLGGGAGSSLLDIDRAASRLRELVNRTEWDQVLAIRSDFLAYLDAETVRLREAMQLYGAERSAQLPQLLAASDAQLVPMLDQLRGIDQQIQAIIADRASGLEQSRARLQFVSWLATVLYFMLVVILWRWSSRSITRPLARLAEASQEALQGRGSLQVSPSGPREVRMLTESLTALTDSLEQTVRERTTDIQTLLDELDHRVRNSLASILSLVRLEQRQHDDHEGLAVLEGRVRAMSRAYELLGPAPGEGVHLHDAIRVILDQWVSASQVHVQGPAVTLRSSSATPLCLLLNELATNASKYGALSVEGGQLEVRWFVKGPSLHVDWIERGGPPLSGPPVKGGSGLGLIEGFVRHDLSGDISWAWEASGLHCHITLRPESLQQA